MKSVPVGLGPKRRPCHRHTAPERLPPALQEYRPEGAYGHDNEGGRLHQRTQPATFQQLPDEDAE
jgi:hypothetical protein